MLTNNTIHLAWVYPAMGCEKARPVTSQGPACRYASSTSNGGLSQPGRGASRPEASTCEYPGPTRHACNAICFQDFQEFYSGRAYTSSSP